MPRLMGGLAVALLAAAAVLPAQGPVPGQSVNMVSGTEWPEGDPFLQRQNEGSIATSSRNSLHLMGGGNDYRTVDIPGLPGAEVTGDAWLGLFYSRDGGNRWKSTLLPGYPQDTSPEGMNSPLKGLQAGADPVVRAGSNGLMGYAGIAFNRDSQNRDHTTGKKGVMFVARFIDDNAKETGNPFRYLNTVVVDNGSSGQFLDKPWFAIDVPRSSAGTCTIPGKDDIPSQTFPAGNWYATYSMFVGNDKNVRSIIWFRRSTDCGATWGNPVKLSEGLPLNQGSVISINPTTGHVYVAWRRLKTDTYSDAIVLAKSTDGGQTFTRATEVASFTPYLLPTGQEVSRLFGQGTSFVSFRTLAYPALAVDQNGVVYVAWSERDIAPYSGARIMMSRSGDGGLTWSLAAAVDNTSEPGHQFMPSLIFHAGKLILMYHTQREDHTVGRLTKTTPTDIFFTETRDPAGNLAAGQDEVVYWDFVADTRPSLTSPPLIRRHTIDLWAAVFDPAPPTTALSVQTARVSRYVFGSFPSDFLTPAPIQQFQFHPPNLPLFACQGELANCRAFVGDYIDLAGASSIVPEPGGSWSFNLNDQFARVFHGIWTDNRDVRPPPDGNWHLYTPPTSPFSPGGAPTPSLFDPNQTRPACDTAYANANPGLTRAGMRNQNLYTSRVTEGLVAGSPHNDKPLGYTTIDGTQYVLQRAFVVFAQNLTDELRTFRFTIANQPADAPAPGRASFSQFPLAGHPDPLTELFVRIPARSSATRTVFVTSGDRNATTNVFVEEFTDIADLGGTLVQASDGGLHALVVLNPDITNPDITNPDITNPDITNPDITNAEVYNPDITNPDITNPDITNPDITNPDITNPDITNPDITNPDITNVQVLNPDITNPDITNPDITNPDITNPDITNPDITNPDITNGTVTDGTWTVQTTGNTTGGQKLKLLTNTELPEDFKTQLIIHRGYSTPVAVGCELGLQRQSIVVANIPNPAFVSASSPDLTDLEITDPASTNATFFVAPGDDWVQITLRIVDTDPLSGLSPQQFLTQAVTPVVIAQSVNTIEAINGSTTPPVAVPGTSIVFLVPPAGGTAGSPISPAVQVQVRDATGALLTQSAVALSIATGPTGATISGNTATTDAIGIATFPLLTLSDAGAYTLAATAQGPAGTDPIAPAITAPFLVTGTGATFLVTNTNDSGPGSLREAITNANRNAPSLDVIQFAIPGAAPHTIALASGLPAITDAAVIDATAAGCAGAQPTVEVFGGRAGAGASGLTVTSGDTTIRGLSITGFGGSGIELQSGGTNVVECSHVGLGTDGVTARGNAADGIRIVDSAGNRIGGSGLGNVVSANGGEGLAIYGAAATGNTIQANLIGTDASGVLDRGNTNSGIYIRRAPGNTALANVVSANDGFAGIAICGDPSFCGGAPLGTTGSNAAGNAIRGNRIGTNAAGNAALGNAQRGVSIDGAPDTVVGGDLAGDGNIIAANGQLSGHAGVMIFSQGADGNLIRGNYIGTNASEAALGNGGPGVLIQAGIGNIVSGKDEDRTAQNFIQFNGGAGIAVTGGSGHRLRINRFDANGGLGIDIGTAGQNATGAPVLASATLSETTITVQGTFSGTPNQTFTLDLFASEACDPSGFGEGRRWFGAFTGLTDENGTLSFNIGFQGAGVTEGQLVTALATAGDFITTLTGPGDTSEFSGCQMALQPGLAYWAPSEGGNGQVYEYVTTALSWTDAKLAAEQRTFKGIQGRLVTINSAGENEFVRGFRTLTGDLRAWIGLTDAATEGTFLWISGELLSYTNWDAGEPNNQLEGEDYVEIFASGFWNDQIDSGAGLIQGYVVEYPTPPVLLSSGH
jgi:hypothetical protein